MFWHRKRQTFIFDQIGNNADMETSSTSLELQGPMRKLHITMETLEAQVCQTNGALATQMQMMTDLRRNTPELYHRQEHAVPKTSRSAAEVNPLSDGLVIIGKPSNLSLKSYETPRQGFVRSETTTFDLTLSSCDPSCICACHKRTRFRSPQFLNSIIGSLFLGYNASPLLGKRCNKDYCRGSSTDITYTYAIPRWFVDRVVEFKMSDNLPKGPELCIRLARMRPSTAAIFIAVTNDSDEEAVRQVERLFVTGGASVHDVDLNGSTALLVKKNSFTKIA